MRSAISNQPAPGDSAGDDLGPRAAFSQVRGDPSFLPGARSGGLAKFTAMRRASSLGLRRFMVISETVLRRQGTEEGSAVTIPVFCNSFSDPLVPSHKWKAEFIGGQISIYSGDLSKRYCRLEADPREKTKLPLVGSEASSAANRCALNSARRYPK